VNNVYIVSAVRTPIGKFGGSLASLSAADMGVVAAKAALERAAVEPRQIEETIFGNARQAGGGPNPARQISIRSGVPQEVSAYTVNKACASGIQSIALAFQEIATGNLECVLAGGTEAASAALMAYYHALRTGEGQCVDVSMQACVIWTLLNTTMTWQCMGIDEVRGGAVRQERAESKPK